MHDRRCTDESCVRTARRSCASTGAVFRRCVVARKTVPLLDVSSNVRYVPPDLIRLRPFHRRLLYGVLALLFSSGAAWAYWNYLVVTPRFRDQRKGMGDKDPRRRCDGDFGVVGMLLTGHVRFAGAWLEPWQGSLFLRTFGILTVTGYGLYYAGGESLRAWTSCIHLAVGLALPLLLILHIWLGKRTRPAAQLRKRPFRGEVDIA